MITIYEHNATDFTTLGLGVLKPLSCTISERAREMYEVYMVVPIAEGTKWDLCKVGRYLKVPAPVRENPEIIQPGSTPTTVTYQLWKCVTSGRLYIRQTPNGTKIGSLMPGDEVMKLAEDTTSYPGATWFKVSTAKGAVGWVLPYTASVTYLQNTGRTKTVTTGGDTPGGSVELALSRTQIVRIYSVEKKTGSGTVEVRANHATYALMGAVWRGTSSAYDIPASQLLQRLRDTTYVSHDAGIELKSYVSGNWKVTGSQVKRNAMNILLDPDDGLVKQLDGWLIRDNFSLYILPKADRDLGFRVRRGKNLISANFKLDISDVVTRVIPLGKTATDGPLWGTAQDSTHINEYGVNAKIIQYDVKAASESSADVAAAKQQLNTLAQREFTRNHIDMPTYSLDAKIAQLEFAPRYAALANMLSMHIYDSVQIFDPESGIDVKFRMTEYQYDCLTKRYTEVIFGEAVYIARDDHQIVYLQYVTSNGGAYVDTGVKAHLNTEVQLDMAMISTSNANAIVIGDITDTSAALSINNKYSGSGSPTSRFGSKTVNTSGAMETGTRYLYTVNKTALTARKVATGAQVTVGTFGQSAAFDSAQTMTLFAGRTAGGVSTYIGNVRVYRCQILENGVTVADLRPALYDDVPCMYDTVSGTPRYNIGPGELVRGPALPTMAL